MRIINKDEFGWQIGSWKTPISIRWFKSKILRWYGIRFDKDYNILCFGRLEIRIWKPKFMRCGYGIYYFKEIPHEKNEKFYNQESIDIDRTVEYLKKYIN